MIVPTSLQLELSAPRHPCSREVLFRCGRHSKRPLHSWFRLHLSTGSLAAEASGCCTIPVLHVRTWRFRDLSGASTDQESWSHATALALPWVRGKYGDRDQLLLLMQQCLTCILSCVCLVTALPLPLFLRRSFLAFFLHESASDHCFSGRLIDDSETIRS